MKNNPVALATTWHPFEYPVTTQVAVRLTMRAVAVCVDVFVHPLSVLPSLVNRLRLSEDIFSCNDVFNPVSCVTDALLMFKSDTLAANEVFRLAILACIPESFEMNVRLIAERFACNEVFRPVTCTTVA
jgi:hypothetical protein